MLCMNLVKCTFTNTLQITYVKLTKSNKNRVQCIVIYISIYFANVLTSMNTGLKFKTGNTWILFIQYQGQNGQTTRHIVEECPLTAFPGGLQRLHQAGPDAVEWLSRLSLKLWECSKRTTTTETKLLWLRHLYRLLIHIALKSWIFE